MAHDIGMGYKVAAGIEHKCEKCNGDIKMVDMGWGVDKALKCPKCKGKLEISNTIDWD